MLGRHPFSYTYFNFQLPATRDCRQLAQSRCRRQSETSRILSDCPKADIDYRLPTLLDAEWKVPAAEIGL